MHETLEVALRTLAPSDDLEAALRRDVERAGLERDAQHVNAKIAENAKEKLLYVRPDNLGLFLEYRLAQAKAETPRGRRHPTLDDLREDYQKETNLRAARVLWATVAILQVGGHKESVSCKIVGQAFSACDSGGDMRPIVAEARRMLDNPFATERTTEASKACRYALRAVCASTPGQIASYALAVGQAVTRAGVAGQKTQDLRQRVVDNMISVVTQAETAVTSVTLEPAAEPATTEA